MELAKNELQAVEQRVEFATDVAIKQLSDLELALAGGGQGQVVIA